MINRHDTHKLTCPPGGGGCYLIREIFVLIHWTYHLNSTWVSYVVDSPTFLPFLVLLSGFLKWLSIVYFPLALLWLSEIMEFDFRRSENYTLWHQASHTNHFQVNKSYQNFGHHLLRNIPVVHTPSWVCPPAQRFFPQRLSKPSAPSHNQNFRGWTLS